MKIYRKQVNIKYGNNEAIDKINEVIYAIEKLLNNYYEMPKSERYNILNVFYTFELDENEDYSVSEIIDVFDGTHKLEEIYTDIKSYLAILIYDVNRNAITMEEEEASLSLKYYYNTGFKQKLRSLE